MTLNMAAMKRIFLYILCLGVMMTIPFAGIQGSDSGNVPFAAHFEDKTMRLDYFHSGNSDQEHFAVDRIVSDGKWAGGKTRLRDDLNLGLYRFEIFAKENDVLLFSGGFAGIFGEWQTTGEAKKEWGAFHESIRFPWPKKTVKVVIKKRDNLNRFVEIWNTEIDPGSRRVNPADLLHANNIFTVMENGPTEKNNAISITEIAVEKANAGLLAGRLFLMRSSKRSNNEGAHSSACSSSIVSFILCQTSSGGLTSSDFLKGSETLSLKTCSNSLQPSQVFK